MCLTWIRTTPEAGPGTEYRSTVYNLPELEHKQPLVVGEALGI